MFIQERTRVTENRITLITNLTPGIIHDCSEYLLSRSEARIYHHPLYLKVLSIESGQPCSIIISRNSEDKINGMMPLLKTRGIPFGPNSALCSKRISSLPRTPYAGILADDYEVFYSILEMVKEMSGDYNRSLIQIKSDHLANYAESGFKSIKWRKTFIKDIPPLGESIKFESRKDERDILRDIRRANEHHVKFRKADSLDDLRDWYWLYLERMRYHKVPARSFLFFRSCWEILKPAGMMDLHLTVIENGKSYEILSGNLNFKFKDLYFGGFKAGNMKKSYLMFGDFLMFNEMQMIQEQGFRFYDLGEVPGGSHNLERYKRRWGADMVQLYHHYYGANSNDISDNIEISGNGDIITKIWRLVPLPVTAAIGKLINTRL